MAGTPCVGDAVTYRLRLSEQPCDPLRLWHGVIEYASRDWYRVRLTDEGYEGLQELIIGFQIVEVVCVDKVGMTTRADN
jgi:hypothetical protein